jgi:hypothetical protein
MNNQFSLLNTKGLDISNPATFESFVTQAKQLQNLLENAWGQVEEQMLNHNVKSIKGDWGSLTIAERKSWKATGDLPPRFYKQTLDTTKLNFMLNHGDTLPEAVEMKTTQYLTKRIK